MEQRFLKHHVRKTISDYPCPGKGKRRVGVTQWHKLALFWGLLCWPRLNPRAAFTSGLIAWYGLRMKTDTVEIPMPVLASVETLDELQDWLTARNPKVIAELRAARREDRAGKFKPWKPRHPPCPTGSK